MDRLKGHVLLVDDDAGVLNQLEAAFESEGFSVSKTDSVASAENLIKSRQFDLIVSEASFEQMSGIELMRSAKNHQPDTEIIIISKSDRVDLAVESMYSGAYYYLKKPVDIRQLMEFSKNAIQSKQLSTGERLPETRVETPRLFDNIIGATPEMLNIFDMIQKVAPSSVPILIQGESGTGKELIAEAIHHSSKRKNNKFLAINTASLPETLLESELFGYRKGAFTGANADKTGLLEAATGGTLFFDEISSMSKSLQSKLLRALEAMEIMRVGDSKPIKIDVRFLSASNRDLKQMVRQGEFREDLYYRLSVIEINVPPLRDRLNDIPLLVNYFLRKFCRQNDVAEKSISRAALKQFYEYYWPGNVRELENVISRAVVTSDSRIIQSEDVIIPKSPPDERRAEKDLYSMRYDEAVRSLLDNFQQEYLRRHFNAAGGNISLVARRTGVTRQTLYNLMKRHNFQRGGRKSSVTSL